MGSSLSIDDHINCNSRVHFKDDFRKVDLHKCILYLEKYIAPPALEKYFCLLQLGVLRLLTVVSCPIR